MIQKLSRSLVGRWLMFFGLLFLIMLAGIEIYNVAGHGAFLGRFDKIWGAIFIAYLVGSAVFLGVLVLILWPYEKYPEFMQPVLDFRTCLNGWIRWPLALIVIAWPAWLLLYTDYSDDFSAFAIRLYFFVFAVVFAGVVFTQGQHKVLTWVGLVNSIVVFGAVFLMALTIVPVTSYPLSLSWSEGNRIWDYSVLFGRDLYIYPSDQPLEAYIDRGRQSLWGLPFLLPNVTILQVRMWSALVFTVPYAILGWILFHIPKNRRSGWVLAGLWVMIFLNQGPIYTPLVLAAILVALARRRPIWFGLPLVFLAGYYAQMSRFTWMLAPAIWAAMMALNDHPLELSRRKLKEWGIVAAYGFAGLLGGFGISGWERLQNFLQGISANITAANLSDPSGTATQAGAFSPLTDQALLWFRLWPNPTYPEGILLGVLLATGPLIIFLIYLAVSKRWALNLWQKLGLFLPMLAFLVVGIVVSVKIGGGSNLHNLDMFLVGLVFVAAFAWECGGQAVLYELDTQTLWLRIVVLLIAAIPAFYPMIDAQPLKLFNLEKADYAIDLIQNESLKAVAQGGEVLFMDQRQLLTFGYIKDIPLVAEYEKKLVMDKAMSGDLAYFEGFYHDLATQRFALIIVEPQIVLYANIEDDWANENDVWVEWVTKPLLCYYEQAHSVRNTKVWLLVPRSEPADCTFPLQQPG